MTGKRKTDIRSFLGAQREIYNISLISIHTQIAVLVVVGELLSDKQFNNQGHDYNR